MLSLLIAAWKRRRERMKRRAALIALLGMNDRVLEDIGISRAEILTRTGVAPPVEPYTSQVVPMLRGLALDGR